MLDLVMVDPEHRRTGVGQALIRHAMTICQTPQLWTSTNRSNTIMQALLVRMGFVPSGMVEGLDIGDPELFYRIDATTG